MCINIIIINVCIIINSNNVILMCINSNNNNVMKILM